MREDDFINMQDLHDAFALLEPTDEQKKRVFARIVKGERKMQHKKTILSLGLAAVLFLALGSLAVAEFALDTDVLGFFAPENERQASYLQQAGAEISAEAEDNGTQIKVTQMVGDKHNIYVFFDVIAPEGTVLSDDFYAFASARAIFDASGGYSIEVLNDDDKTDNKIRMALELDAFDSLQGQNLHLQLQNLQRYDEAADEMQTVLAGDWQLDFNLDYSDTTKTYKLSQRIELPAGSVDLQSLEISAIGASLGMKGIAADDGDFRFDYDGDLDNPQLVITLQDGSRVEYSGIGTGTGVGQITGNYQFANVIDPADIASISFRGVTLEY